MAGKGKRKARIIFTLAAYALAGLVTTLGIAWSPHAPIDWPDHGEWKPPAGRPASELLPAATLRVDRFSHWNGNVYGRNMVFRPQQGEPYPAPPSNPSALADELRALNYQQYNDSTVEPPQAADSGVWIAEFRGVPFRCVWAWRDFVLPRPASGFPHSYFDLTNALGGAPDPNRYLPVTPVWPGLIANTAIWGLAWYALLFLPLRLLPWSAASRKRRGLCIECGYDLTGIQGRCPECGEEISMGGTKATSAK